MDLPALIDFHGRHAKLATVTAVQPPGRYGALDVRGEQVHGFQEKPLGDGGWINGGFFVLEPGVFDYIEGDATTWEYEPMRALAQDGQLMTHVHRGFWQAMDTLRDRSYLEERWKADEAQWRIWS